MSLDETNSVSCGLTVQKKKQIPRRTKRASFADALESSFQTSGGAFPLKVLVCILISSQTD